MLAFIATDKGYYSLSNEQLLIENGVIDIQLPRPDRTQNTARETTPWLIRQLLHNRRAGIEPLISHTKLSKVSANESVIQSAAKDLLIV